MDGTPDYLHIPSAACRIKATFPNARFIVLLRDPVSRAFSHWNMGAFFGSTKSFPFTVNDEMKQLAKAHCTFQPPISAQTGFNVTVEFLDKQGLPPVEVSGSATKRYMADSTRRGTSSPSDPIGSIQQGKMIRPQGHVGLEAGAGSIVQEAGEQDAKQLEPEKENVEENQSEDSTQQRQVLLDFMPHEAMTTWRRQAGIPSWNACFKCTFQCKNDVLKARRGDTAPGGGDVWFYCHRQFSSTALIRRGLYVYQLEWWLKLFKPGQFLIINHEELKTNPEAVISKAISFLGQDLALLQPPHHGHKENTLKYMAATTDLNNAFLSKTTSGWSLPLKDGDAVQKYNSTIEKLYKFYAHPNQELYRLLKTMGPSSGWHGEFPADLESGDFE
ncbi:hypothetical protein CEUSTIGMA_g4480.t1 [Chlamydomonas eustigma]|uniref:Sulfotransferase n=1 Tax=Chlamydomonas eustigma TaxID=1157962 RepID=A0A250X1S1_9CHLO|nr:hypothetical protein CEUSTIGMA_g4480.t1 [Chlamydomonas eustigma]|eukprot:GAX77033.1 hypothetical protein CEUSTIGMA_g4480.t1 [Chlamydomonas eustigma]